MQEWLPPDMLDLHGYVTPTLIEATTKPHNPSIEYDLWLKWNQARIDANEAAMNAIGMAVTRPINDWCPNGDSPPASTGLCAGGIQPGPAVAEGWDDWGPFYTPMYSQHIGLNGSTVEMCNSTDHGLRRRRVDDAIRAVASAPGSRSAGHLVDAPLRHRERRRPPLATRLEIYRRGVVERAAAGVLSAAVRRRQQLDDEYPMAYVIPIGAGQRSDAEANRLVDWLLDQRHRGRAERRPTYASAA